MPQQNSVRERAAAAPVVSEYRTSTLRYILFDGRVLRPGWGIFAFFSLFWIVTLGQTLFLLRIGHFPRPSLTPFKSPRDLMLPQLLALISVTVATIVPSLFEQRRLAEYGFSSRRSMRLLGGGALSGLLVISTLVLTLRQMHLVQFSQPNPWNVFNALRQGGVWVVVYGVLALMLGMLTRGYPQYTLTRGFAYIYRTFFLARTGVSAGFWTATLLLSSLSALLQILNANESSIGLIWVGCMSFLYCLSLWRSGSLWWAIGFQTAWDVAQSFIFGVPDSGILTRDHLQVGKAAGAPLWSGGATGPEGSVLTVGAFFLMLACVLLLRRQRVYPDLWEIAETSHLQRERQMELHDEQTKA